MKGIFNKVMLSLVIGSTVFGSTAFASGYFGFCSQAVPKPTTVDEFKIIASSLSRIAGTAAKNSSSSFGTVVNKIGHVLVNATETPVAPWYTRAIDATCSFGSNYVYKPAAVCGNAAKTVYDAGVTGGKLYVETWKTNPCVASAATIAALGLGYVMYKYVPLVTNKVRRGIAHGFHAVGDYVEPERHDEERHA